MFVSYLLQTLQFCLVFMPSTANHCDDGVGWDCAAFETYLAKIGQVSKRPDQYCEVLVKKPMTFHQAAATCTEAGGHLVKVKDKEQVEELVEFAQMDGVRVSSSSDDGGIWATACLNVMNMPDLKWVGQPTPSSESQIEYGAKLILCSDDGDKGLCRKQPVQQRGKRLPFFCVLGRPDELHQVQSETEVITNISIIVLPILFGILILVIIAFAIIHRRRKGVKNVEAAQGTEQKRAEVPSMPQQAQGPEGGQPGAEGGQSGPEGGQPASEGGQPAAESGQPAAEEGQSGDKEPPSSSSKTGESTSEE